MTSDDKIRHDVERELKSDPTLGAADIAVAVHDRVVSLTGFVRRYRHRQQAEVGAKRVAGVVGVANDIEVRLPVLHQRPDPQIAHDAIAALRRSLPDAAENIVVLVCNGWVTLEGEVDWNFEREEARWEVAPVRGVIGVTNAIRIRPRVAAADVQSAIVTAFRRSAAIDASQLQVEVNGDQVILRGTLRSWAERSEAERAAWQIPGVSWVDNQIAVEL